MSNFRDRAKAVREAGKAERGNFTPRGVPLKIYKYWERYAEHIPAQENFCHFWRVVLFWAPLRAVTNKLGDLFANFADTWDNKAFRWYLIAFAATVALLVAIAFPIAGKVLMYSLLGLLGVTALFGGMASGAVRQSDAYDDLEPYEHWVDRVFWLTLPASILGYGLSWLGNNWKETWSEWLLKAFLATASLGGLAFVAALIYSEGWVGLFILVGGTVGAVALFVGLIALADYIEGRARLHTDELEERWEMYQRSEIEYDEIRVRKSPGKVARFFGGLGDFIVLVFQIVRVKKWKICPMVEID